MRKRLIDADALDAAFTDLRFNADGTLAHWGDRPDWCLHGREVEKLIHDAPTVGGWISVEDRLPDDGVDVLILASDDGGKFMRIAWKEHGEWMDEYSECMDECEYRCWWANKAVSHWMPLPEPPTGN